MTAEDEVSGARRRPTGRRAGDSGTRGAILDAASALFARSGYEGASLRAIAGEAGVDPALIRHFFGDKASLFAAAVSDRSAIPERLLSALPGDPAGLGRRATDAYLGLWEDGEVQPVLLALIRSAVTSQQAAQMFVDVVSTQVQERIGGSASPERTRRTALAGTHLLGVALARHVLRLPPIADLDHDHLVDLVAPAIQSYLAPPED